MTPLHISHTTSYRYSSPVTLDEHRLLLRLRVGHDIRITHSELTISPLPRKLIWSRDVYGNSVARVTFDPQPTSCLTVASEIRAEHYDDQPLDFLVEDRALNFPYPLLPSERIELSPYLIPCFPKDQDGVANWIGTFWQTGQLIETYVLLDRINRNIASTFKYAAREAVGVQRPSKTLQLRSGSCRDFATLMIEACRYLGLPARFVSGYASTEDIPAALGATHAWTEVYLPGAGWKGFDSTGGIVVGPKHLAVAVGRDPESLPPIAGSFRSDVPDVESTLDVKVSVTRA